MTELQLYNFLTLNYVKTRWDGDILAAWIPDTLIGAFGTMAARSGDTTRITCVFIPQKPCSYLWVDLVPICEYFGINPENISPKTEQ